MPFPLLPILGALSALTGITSGAYGLGATIAEKKKQKKLAEEAAKKQQQAIKDAQKAGKSTIQSPVQQGAMPEGFGTYTVYSPQQQQALNFALQQAISGLGQNKFDFAPIAQKARTDFAQQTIPSIAERFSGLGTGGSQRSNAFTQALGQAGAGLEQGLAGMQQGYNLDQQKMLMALLGLGLQPQYEAFLNPNSGSGLGFGKSLAMQLLQPGAIGGHISSIADAVQGIKNYKNQQLAGTAQNMANLSSTLVNTPPPFQPTNVINPTSSLGAFNTLYGTSTLPGGVVPGLGVPPTLPTMPTSSLGALTGLYGI